MLISLLTVGAFTSVFKDNCNTDPDPGGPKISEPGTLPFRVPVPCKLSEVLVPVHAGTTSYRYMY